MPTTMTMPTSFDARLTPQVLSFEKALNSTPEVPTPAALTEAMLPLLDESRWLKVNSSSMADQNACTAMKLILDRTAARGVSIVFDVNWKPQAWGLEPGSPPTSEVKRRIQPLIDAAMLIHCSSADAQILFHSSDPTRIHNSLRKRPAVLIRGEDGATHWCLAGRSGVVSADADRPDLLETLLRQLSGRPDLLGGHNPGTKAIADPAEIRKLFHA